MQDGEYSVELALPPNAFFLDKQGCNLGEERPTPEVLALVFQHPARDYKGHQEGLHSSSQLGSQPAAFPTRRRTPLLSISKDPGDYLEG